MARHKPGNPKNSAITPKMEAFVTAFIRTFNATEAALAAGYSPKTACAKGSWLLREPRVSKMIKDFQEKSRANAIMTFEERAQILSEIARGKMSDFLRVSDDGLVALKVSAEQTNRAALMNLDQRIESEDRGGGIVTNLKLRDPVPAIRELNEMYGDHAPKRSAILFGGSIDNMSEDEVKAELERLETEKTDVETGKAKAGRTRPE